MAAHRLVLLARPDLRPSLGIPPSHRRDGLRSALESLNDPRLERSAVVPTIYAEPTLSEEFDPDAEDLDLDDEDLGLEDDLFNDPERIDEEDDEEY